MDGERHPRVATLGNRDLRRDRALPEAEQPGRGTVAQQRAFATGPYCRPKPAPLRQVVVPHGVDAVVEHDQPSLCDAPAARAPPEPECVQLVEPRDPVLRCAEPREVPLVPALERLCIAMMLRRSTVEEIRAHGGMRARRAESLPLLARIRAPSPPTMRRAKPPGLIPTCATSRSARTPPASS